MKLNYLNITGLKTVLAVGLFLATSIIAEVQAQNNIAPLATITSNRSRAAPYDPKGLNDLAFGTCGTQQVWFSSGSPPSTTIGVDWIQWDFPSPKQFDEMIIHHGQTVGRFLNGGTLQYQSGSTWVTFHVFSNLPTVCVNSVKFPRVRAKTFRLTRWETSTNGQRSNINFREIEIIESPEFKHSARIGNICSPTSPTCGTIPTSLVASVYNMGTLPLDSVTMGARIHYQLGSIRDTVFTPEFYWKGHLNSKEESTCDTIFNWSNGFRTGDSIYIWTAYPNGVLDTAYEDDTTLLIIRPSMPAGLYTIGDTLHDFTSLAEAFTTLCDTFGGVCDTVIFELDSSSKGSFTYWGQYDICNVSGTSWNAPIIVRSNDTLGKPITLFFDSCDKDNNYLLGFDGSNHMIFENLNISTSDAAYRNGFSSNVKFKQNSSDIRFIDVNFMSDQTGSAAGGHTLITSESGLGDNISIENCNFSQGSTGISLDGGDDHSITGSRFVNQYFQGVVLSNTRDAEIAENTFSSNSALVSSAVNDPNSFASAIFMSNNKGGYDIHDNLVRSSNSEWPVAGIVVEGHNALSQQAYAYNNVINIGQPWSSVIYHPIHVEGSRDVDFYFNTAAVSGNNLQNAALFADASSGIILKNNILAAMLRGFSIDLKTGGSVSNSDYNDLYSPVAVGQYQGVSQTTLADWQSTSTGDANSINAIPNFYNRQISDMHVCNQALYEAGTGVAGITMDMDGDIRNSTMPCIGADEFAPVQSFSLGNDYGLCPGDSTNIVAGSGNFGELSIWKDLNTGMPIDTNQILTVHTPGSFEVTVINACGILIDSIDIIQPAAVALPGDTNLCPDATTSFDATIVDGTTYAWSSGDTTPQITVTKEANYGVVVTDKWSCVTTDTVKVTYSERATLNVNDTIVCEGISVTLFGSISNGPDVSYVWSGFLGASQITDDNTLVDYEQVDDKDTIIVELTHRGCVTYDTVNIERIPKPKVVYTHDTNGLAFNVRTNTSSGNQHWWDFGDGDTSVFPMPRHLYATAGTYTVTYKNKNICGEATDTREISLILLGVENLTSGSGFVLFPNPNNGIFNIQLEGVNNEEVSIQVIDMGGKIVHSENYGSINGDMNKEVQIDGLNAGMYILNLKTNDKIQTARFIVE